MNTNKIKCFAVDVDGTIADNNGQIDLEAAATLRNLSKLGYQIVFVSGRTAWELMILAKYIGTSNISVGENGGVIAKSPLDIQIIGDKSKTTEAFNLLCKEISNVKIKPSIPRLSEVVLERSFDIEIGRKIISENNLQVNLIDSNFAYHITDNTVDKGKGLKIALKYLKIDSSETIAIGDSDTDVPMFKTCKYSISVGKATENAKKNSVYNIDSPSGEGLNDALDLAFQKIISKLIQDDFNK